MVEVFKTNVQEVNDANRVLALLLKRFPTYQINFDLEDCDKILRVAGNDIFAHEIKGIVVNHGFECTDLVD